MNLIVEWLCGNLVVVGTIRLTDLRSRSSRDYYQGQTINQYDNENGQIRQTFKSHFMLYYILYSLMFKRFSFNWHYGYVTCSFLEWNRRGYKTTCTNSILPLLSQVCIILPRQTSGREEGTLTCTVSLFWYWKRNKAMQ